MRKLTHSNCLFYASLAIATITVICWCLPAHCQQSAIDINARTRGNLSVSRLQPGVAGQCLTTDIGGNTNWGSCAAGSGTVTSFSAGNVAPLFTCSVSNPTTTPALTCTVSNAAAHTYYGNNSGSTGPPAFVHPASTELADFSATAPASSGKVPIYDSTAANAAGGTGAYVPGDPLVQGLNADGSTAAENPVVIGGYDTAGTPALHRATFINGNPSGSEYGQIVRNIPSGTQAISGSVSVSNFPSTQPVTQSGTWTVQPGNTANTTAWKVDGSAVTQPVSAASLPLPSGAATAAKQPALGTAGAPSADVITVQGAAGMTPVKTDGSSATQPISGSVSVSNFPATQAVTQSGTWTVQPGNTANTTAWKVDGSSVTQPVSAASLPLPSGAATSANQATLKSNNAGAPGTGNVGTLPAVANAAPPSFTEGNQGAISMDLKGNIRVYDHPPDVVGCYMVNGRTSTYAGLAAGTPLFSYRWGDATHLGIIQRVRVAVATTAASTTNSGQAERELIVARGFTASDTGGTAVTLTGSNQKMRTSQGTSLVTDMRFGTTITAGTRTLDANPIASAVAWLGVNFTGLDIGCGGGAAATAAAWTCAGGMGFVDLLNATNGQTYPLVLAQNEGFIIRVGKDTMPTGFTQQTYVEVDWCEVNAY